MHRLLDLIGAAAPSTAFVDLFATADAVPLCRRGGSGAGDLQGLFRPVRPAWP